MFICTSIYMYVINLDKKTSVMLLFSKITKLMFLAQLLPIHVWNCKFFHRVTTKGSFCYLLTSFQEALFKFRPNICTKTATILH
jgi:hypothetical protein